MMLGLRGGFAYMVAVQRPSRPTVSRFAVRPRVEIRALSMVSTDLR
jgi:hypothetical protein